MTKRSVSVSIKADVAQFQAAMKQAAAATKQVDAAAKTTGKTTQAAGTAAAAGSQKMSTAATGAAAAQQKSGQAAQAAATQTQKAGAAAGAAAAGTQKLTTATTTAAASAGKLSSASGTAATATGKISTATRGAVGDVDKFGNSLSTADVAAGRFVNAGGRVSEANGKMAAGFGKAQAAAQQSSASAEQAATGWGKLAQTARENEEAWGKVSNTFMVAGGAALLGVGMAVKTYADYDKAMSSVRAATHASESDMQALGDAAVKAGADTAFSAEEAARGIEELAKAGVSTSDILGGGLDGALSLAAAGGLEVGDAAEIAASALTQFKLEGSDVTHVADLLAAGAGKAQGSVHDLGMALNQSGLVAAQTGLSIEETTGGLAAFASAGLVGSDAGTSFKTMLQRLTPQSEAAAKMMDDLGISAYDSQGNFIGLSEYAGKLQGALSGMSEEQRNATMQTLFGSDAIRAASVLYEQGSEGVEKWESAVNDAGYAAETAALMQDNLAGDIEKLGGALDTVFLKSGSGANDALRGIVQGAEDVVDAIGRIPGPVLTAVAGLAAFTGGAALVVGGGMKLVALGQEVGDAFSAIGAKTRDAEGNVTRTGRAIGTAGKLAAGAAVGFAALQTVGALDGVLDKSTALGIEEVSNALAGAGDGMEDLNDKFANLDFVNGKGRWSVGGTVSDINSLGDAIHRVNEAGGMDGFGDWVVNAAGQDSALQKLAGSIEEVDTALASMYEAGNQQGAMDLFSQIVEDAEAAGVSVQDTAKAFPELEGAVLDYATSLGVTLSPQEALDAMMGNLPPKLEAAAGGAEAAAAGLGEAAGGMDSLAGASEDASKTLGDIVDQLFALGFTTQDARGALTGYEDSLRALKAAVDEGGASLNAMGDDFDITTEAGSKMSDAFGDVAGAGIEAAKGQIELGNGSAAARDSLISTYDSLVSTAEQLGMSSEAAEALAGDLLGIPEGVSVETEMDSRAREMAGETDAALDAIDSSKTVIITAEDAGSVETVKSKIAGIQGTQVAAYVSDKGTTQLTQQQINDIYGKTTKVQVTDDGTVYHTQGAIDGVTDGDAKIWVGDDGTIYDVQGTINGVQDGAATVHVSESGVSSVQEAINQIKGKTVTVAVQTVRGGALGSALAGHLGKAEGGRAPSIAGLPAAARGMRLPTTGPGTSTVDGIMGVASNGMPRVRVDAGEWITNAESSEKYNRLLTLVNDDDPAVHHLRGYATGGRAEYAPAPVSALTMTNTSQVQIDYERLGRSVASAMAGIQILSPVNIDNRAAARIVGVGTRAMSRGR